MIALITKANAGALFATTAAGGPGELYTLDPLTGSVLQDIGPLNDSTDLNYPITGLAFNPKTGVLYGSTANSDPVTAAKLVTIDIKTAQVTVIGSFNAGNSGTKPSTMADLSFDPVSGTLFGIGSVGGPQLYSINLTNGKATLVGSTGLTSTSGGGLAVNAAGEFFGSPTPSRFGTYNRTNGHYVNITTPDLPIGGAYAAFSFDSNGVLYGLDLGTEVPPTTELVTIDTDTGAVTDIGPSIDSIDAIAFQPDGPPPTLTNLKVLGNGAFQFAFTGDPSAGFTVLSTTNLALPLSNWTTEGAPTNGSPGQFQFTSSPNTNDTRRFYRVRSP